MDAVNVGIVGLGNVGSGTLDPQGTVTVHYVRQPDGIWRTDPTMLATLPYTVAKPLPVSLPYTPVSPMPARLTNSPETPLPVEISAIKKVGEWEPLRPELVVEVRFERLGPL